ncbi:MAG: MBL fold metallo-hydrolase RNA specificity domain-containing protein [Longimicrobiales bacterium]
MRLTFLGATQTVTGSKFLLDTGSRQVLFDCGLFQGLKELRKRNWAAMPIDPKAIDAVVLTHAHLDHSGYLPLLVKNGFAGSVYCTAATRDLCGILLPDSGHIQEEEAERANRRGYSKHDPALPLYTQAEAEHALKRMHPIPYGQDFDLGDGLHARFDNAGHILGAAFITVKRGGLTIAFSGDLGRPDDPILFPPTALRKADVLLVESTYGNRDHSDSDPSRALAAIIRRTAARGGTVIIPANAVGRSQLIMYYVHVLKQAGQIPDIPIYLDSPMAANVTGLFHEHHELHKLDARETETTFATTRIVNSVDESKSIDRSDLPKIVISASGMATGGRVLHHLKAFASDAKNTVLFVGYQAVGTRGSAMLGGAREVRIHGADVRIEAEVAVLDGLSAHADAVEILDWLSGFEHAPRNTYIVHGEPAAAAALRERIRGRLGWDSLAPEYRQVVTID